MVTTAAKLTFKSGINLYSGSRPNEYFIGTLRKRIAIYGASAPAIYGAFKRGASSADIESSLVLTAHEVAD